LKSAVTISPSHGRPWSSQLPVLPSTPDYTMALWAVLPKWTPASHCAARPIAGFLGGEVGGRTLNGS
ncbi:hypothetical protein CLOM_g14109, partial [Closterium sp. NIES-68]